MQRNALIRKVGVALRRPDRVVQELSIWADYVKFLKQFSFLREGSRFVSESKTVLIVSLSNWLSQIKMEGMLAKALELYGYRPTIVTLRNARWAHRYFRAFGFDDQMFFDDLVERVPQSVAHEAQEVLKGPLSFEYLFGCKYRGSYVGRHVLSTVVRQLRNGSVEFDDPEVLALLREFLPYAFRCVWASEALVERTRPQLALFLERGVTGVAEIFDVAINQGTNTIQFVHAHRSDALILKRYTPETRHFHPFSLSEDSWKAVQSLKWNDKYEQGLKGDLQDRYEQGTWFSRKFVHEGKALKSQDQVRAQLGLDPDRKTVVVYSHVLWDATFFFGENLFRDYEEWLIETVKVACKNTAVNWVIKIHPDYVWKLKQIGSKEEPQDMTALNMKVGSLPSHIKLLRADTDINTFSIFGITDYGITVRGTIGIELSCLGRPVITAGTGRYSGLGFTYDSVTRKEYFEKLSRIQELPSPLSPEKTELAKKYAYAVFNLRPLPFKTFEQIQMPFHKLGHPLDHNVVIRANSLEDLRKASDLDAFARWAADRSQLDFLLPISTP